MLDPGGLLQVLEVQADVGLGPYASSVAGLGRSAAGVARGDGVFNQ